MLIRQHSQNYIVYICLCLFICSSIVYDLEYSFGGELVVGCNLLHGFSKIFQLCPYICLYHLKTFVLQGRISLYVLMISLGIIDLKFLILNKVFD